MNYVREPRIPDWLYKGRKKYRVLSQIFHIYKKNSKFYSLLKINQEKQI